MAASNPCVQQSLGQMPNCLKIIQAEFDFAEGVLSTRHAEDTVDFQLTLQAVENMYGPGGLWGFLQMPFGDYGPQDVPWPDVPIQISKQYYTMMQA